MRITALVENTSLDPKVKTEHGLSLAIEVNDQKILFDLGQGTFFLENAEKFGIDIKAIEVVIISHGHYDHGGGLATFLEINDKAKIYLSRYAFDEFYSKQTNGEYTYIGLNQALKNNDRFVLIDQDIQINPNLKIYTKIQALRLSPVGNHSLYKKQGQALVNEDFAHEINLVITEGSKKVLFAGCAHSGIINIVDQVSQKEGRTLDVVIGGFHLHSLSTQTDEEESLIEAIANDMSKLSTQFFTCHCTGSFAYALMKAKMNEQIDYLSTGQTVEIKDACDGSKRY